MSKALLIDIQYDNQSFIFSALSAMDKEWVDFTSEPLGEPYPIVKDVPAGNYSLVLKFINEQSELALELYDEAGKLVKQKTVSIEPMFSAMADNMDMMLAQETLSFSEDEDNFADEVSQFFSDSDGVMDATNKQLATQSRKFAEFITDWFEFDESTDFATIGNIYMHVIANATPIISMKRQAMFGGNFKPAGYIKN